MILLDKKTIKNKKYKRYVNIKFIYGYRPLTEEIELDMKYVDDKSLLAVAKGNKFLVAPCDQTDKCSKYKHCGSQCYRTWKREHWLFTENITIHNK